MRDVAQTATEKNPGSGSLLAAASPAKQLIARLFPLDLRPLPVA
jgi:hypothetical protein